MEEEVGGREGEGRESWERKQRGGGKVVEEDLSSMFMCLLAEWPSPVTAWSWWTLCSSLVGLNLTPSCYQMCTAKQGV